MTAKEFLGQIQQTDKQIISLIEQKERHRYYASKGTSTISAVRYGGTSEHSKIEDHVIKMIQFEKTIDKLNSDLMLYKSYVLAFIEMAYNPDHRTLLAYRYIHGWNWRNISMQLNIDQSTAWRMHEKALVNIQLMIDYYQYEKDAKNAILHRVKIVS